MLSARDPLRQAILSRRQLLQLFGVGAMASVVGYSRFSKPAPAVHQRDTLELPHTPSQPLHVAIIGGGLAGLACAHELSQRGIKVTLLEKSPQLGGKIASWPIKVGDHSFMMEHGFHGFFPQYYNLWSLMDDLEARTNFVSLDSYAVVYKGDYYEPEVFRPSHSAFPWNIVDLGISSGNRFKWGLNFTKMAHWNVFREITGFRPASSYARLDHLSVTEWMGNEFPQGLLDLYFLPFAKSSLNAPDVMSAGELMQFFHFYFFGNPEGLAFAGTKQDMGRSVVDPIAKAIRHRGGTILNDITISSIEWQDGQIRALNYQTDDTTTAPFWVTANDYTPGLASSTLYGAGDAVYAVDQQKQAALSLTCTHQGCTVQAGEDGCYHCPCHGAKFAADGTVLEGPAQRDLARYTVTASAADQVQLVSATATDTAVATLEADYFVIAADIPGVQTILSRSRGDVNPELQTQIAALQVADPFAVARFWFDRDFDWPHSDFTSLSGYRLTDSITLYHRIQDDYKAWAAETGGSVVELHAYCYKEAEFPTQLDVLSTFESELYEIVPPLAAAKLLHRELVNQKNFAGFPPGSYANRPETQSVVANLLFAGDWVKMPFPCGLMERAVSSGFLAANAILQAQGVQRRPIYSVSPEGLLANLPIA